MNHDPHDGDADKDGAQANGTYVNSAASQNDRAILDYLDEILRDTAADTATAAENIVRAPLVAPDNIAAFDVSRPRKPDPAPARAKAEPRQPVTLPFRTAEKPRVVTSPALLNVPSVTQPAEDMLVEEITPQPSIPAAAAPKESTHQEAIPKESIQQESIQQETARQKTTPQEPVEIIHDLAPSVPAPEPAVTPVTSEPDLLTLETESAAAAELLPPVQEWHDNGRPAWAQHRFECLIFSVGGLKLAVPLMTLGAIHRIDRKFNALPHQSSWFLGILQTPAAGNIKVLDTALCVMPERYDPASRDSLGYVITIHGYAWGLACHQVEKSITLEPDQVKWRTQRGKRPWLAGTVIDHMCALIDTEGFRDLILKAEQSR